MDDEKKELARLTLKRRAVAVDPGGPFTATPEELKALAETAGVEVLDLAALRFPLKLLDLIPRETAEAHCLLPVQLVDDELSVVMADTTRQRVVEELEFVTGKRVIVFVAPAVDIQETIERAYLHFRRHEEFFAGPKCSADGGSTAPPALPLLSARMSQPAIALGAGIEQQLAPTPSPEQDPSRRTQVMSAAPRLPPVEIPDLEPGQRGLAAERAVPAAASVAIGEPGGLALVVEDDAAIANMIGMLLAARQLEVRTASDGESALLALKECRPRLVVLDAMLPGVHGFEIVRRMRASATFRDVPIIIVTAAHRGWEYAEDLRTNWGVLHYIEKPFETGRFLRAVDATLGAEPLNMDDRAAAQLRAGIDAFKKGELESAEEHLQRGLSFDPFAFQLHFHLGLLHGKRGQSFQAISAIKQAVELNPEYFPAVKNLAILYLRAGFKHKAAEMWQRALGLAPDEATRTTIRQRIAGLRA